jgi:hypothetical protein
MKISDWTRRRECGTGGKKYSTEPKCAYERRKGMKYNDKMEKLESSYNLSQVMDKECNRPPRIPNPNLWSVPVVAALKMGTLVSIKY